MKKKAVFFDWDGTLHDSKLGVPNSTKEAVSRLMANGHEAFLCTGRSRAFVPKEALALGLHGIVAACGAYLEYQGTCIANIEMAPDIAKKSVELLRKYGLVPIMEGAKHLYCDKDEFALQDLEAVDGMIEQLGDGWRPITGFKEDLHINKISAKYKPGCDAKTAFLELSAYVTPILETEERKRITTELVPNGISKATGIEAMIRHRKIPWEDTVVFGDSINDISMFTYAHTKVAMGNACESLKEKADVITHDIQCHGIYYALKQMELIN